MDWSSSSERSEGLSCPLLGPPPHNNLNHSLPSCLMTHLYPTPPTHHELCAGGGGGGFLNVVEVEVLPNEPWRYNFILGRAKLQVSREISPQMRLQSDHVGKVQDNSQIRQLPSYWVVGQKHLLQVHPPHLSENTEFVISEVYVSEVPHLPKLLGSFAS